mgnify:CR=1 FL=1
MRQFRFVRDAGRIATGSTREMSTGTVLQIAKDLGCKPWELGIWTDYGKEHYTERATRRLREKQEQETRGLLARLVGKIGGTL